MICKKKKQKIFVFDFLKKINCKLEKYRTT